MTLKERRDEASVRVRSLLTLCKDESRGMTAEEKTIYTRAVDEINDVDDLIKMDKEQELRDAKGAIIDMTLEQTEKREFEQEKGKGKKEDRTANDAEAFRNFTEYGIGNIDNIPKELRAMTTVTGSTGGFMVPEIFSKQFFTYAGDDSPTRALSTEVMWKGDGAFPVVTAFGTSYLVAEGSDVTTTTPTLAQKTVSGYQLMYNVDVPIKLIDNSAYPFDSNLLKWWAISNANKEESLYAVGAGTTEPFGLTVLATNGTETAANSAIVPDDVVNWYYDVPFKYRKKSSWILNDSSILLIRKMVNAVTTSGATSYVWAPGLGGEPDTLMGRPIYPSDGMAAFAAGGKVGVFGDISQYQIVDFGSPLLIRDPYTVAVTGRVRFVGHRLIDAALPVEEAIISCRVVA